MCFKNGMNFFFSLFDFKQNQILMLRNPYESALSYWNHLRARDSSGPGLRREDLLRSLKSDAFCRFAANEARLWRTLALDAAAVSPEVHLMHYEEFREDPVRHLRGLMK